MKSAEFSEPLDDCRFRSQPEFGVENAFKQIIFSVS